MRVLLIILMILSISVSCFGATYIGLGLGVLGYTSSTFRDSYSSNAVPSLFFENVDYLTGFGFKMQVSSYNNIDKDNMRFFSYVPVDMSILYYLNPLSERTMYIGGGITSIIINENMGEIKLIDKAAVSASNFIIGMGFNPVRGNRVCLEFMSRTASIDSAVYPKENIGTWQFTINTSWDLTPPPPRKR